MADGTLAEALGHALLAGGLGTGLGALPVLVVRRIGPQTEAALAGFSAGVMLAASFVGLLLPALAMASSWSVLLGAALGAIVIDVLHRRAPHEHFQKGREHAQHSRLARVWLLAIALALHNAPEGLAVGVGVASGDEQISWPVTLSIGLQNVPEGLIVAVAFVAAGQSKAKALWVTLLTGLVEPLGAVFGFAAGQLANAAIPVALGFAAGAMLFVVSHEVIPESHREGRSARATFGLMIGVLGMLQIDAWLG